MFRPKNCTFLVRVLLHIEFLLFSLLLMNKVMHEISLIDLHLKVN